MQQYLANAVKQNTKNEIKIQNSYLATHMNTAH